MDEVNYKQLWDLAENNVRALEARLKASLRMCEDWELAFHDLEKKYNELMNAD